MKRFCISNNLLKFLFSLSRFDNHVPDIKNRDCIEVDRELAVPSANYGIIGSIHHHGSSIASGHYTCNIFYPDLAFLCNDNQILPLNASQLSDSVYMFFMHAMCYLRADCKGEETLPLQVFLLLSRLGSAVHRRSIVQGD